jgi:tetratricopeptide (TPR) repeat protein
MNKKAKILFILTVFIGLTLAAEDLSVDYIDGYLDVQRGSRWVEVFPGDVVSTGDTIRLDQDSFAELRGRNKTLSLTEPGIYEVSRLLAAQTETASLGLGSIVSGKLSVLLNDSQVKTQSAVGGVRASEAAAAPVIDWMESESLELIDKGKELLAAGNTGGAIRQFEEAYDLAMDDQEETMASYHLGYAYAVEGNTGKALKYLTLTDADPYLENYHNHILLAGNLLINSFAYEKAAALFDSYNPSGAAYKAPETEQMIYLLHGMSLKMKGDTALAGNWLRKSINVDSQSDTAAKARELLSSL